MSKPRYKVSKLRRTLRRFPEELRADIAKEMDDGSRMVLEEVKARAPVDEGNLREN